MKNKILSFLLVTVLAVALVGCTKNVGNTKLEDTSSQDSKQENKEKLNVVTTIFPYYDFVRQIAGDKVNLTMLVPTGVDVHSFEPTPANMVTIQEADIFFYNGGGMEKWVPQVLEAVENKDQIADCMMDHVKTVVEETVEGMEPEQEEEAESQDGEEEPEYDEHIWTSPVNAQKIVAELCEVLAKADPIKADLYRSNTDAYIKKLQKLDGEFRDVVNHAERKTIIFGDKFPLRYFAEEYGLTYSAAFNGCSTETEPSVDTIAFLIDKVKEEKVPVVYHIELNNGTVANTIAEATGTKVLLFHACHNVSKEDFDKGVTYLDLMEKNVEALKEGLGNE